jgi:AbrB family looped-hinge helix DNA binding protein
MPGAILRSNGRITLPGEVRAQLRLRAGDRIEFVIESGGMVSMRAATLRVADLKGLLRRKGRRPVGIDAMNAAARRGARRA